MARHNPSNDGIDHVNVYSRGNTRLGRYLSNFFAMDPPIETEDGSFVSIEGYWYWLSVDPTNPRREELRTASGSSAKALGRRLRGNDWPEVPRFQEKICSAIRTKILISPGCMEQLSQNRLPFAHYYVMGGEVREPKEGKWILQCILDVQLELQS